MKISILLRNISKYILFPLALYISFPVLFKYGGKYSQKLIYLTQLQIPSNIKSPKKNGIIGKSKNIYIKDENLNNIGVYYIQAYSDSISHNNNNYIDNTDILKSDKIFVLYFHGSKGTRASKSRTNLYNILSQELDYNILTLDYSGFADSEGEANMENIINSSKALINFAETNLSNNYIVWGHSLGGGILLETLAKNSFNYKHLLGIVLESTFTSLKDSLYYHPYTLLYNWSNKIMETFIINPLNKHGVILNNKCNISKINVPILILHAIDDNKVPIQLGQQLYEEAILKGKTVDMIVYDKDQKLGHSEIYRANSFKNDINKYINNCISFGEKKIEKI
ncbi:Hypothetical protein SRAE_2000005100 [Strongyloides ratti]|uniref:Peptidase_S9 domain-containing protein n=1 Tax=Strongyloides ratti TaxID=34506 RepID=A0A090LCY4_STRRB|nr:Hypothetical protein SRAE_2000005100 [Strongyloides ratti]CEF65370.1 Hypothetical protein SRAE_2000005100 [Strongyloides ratti]